MGFESGKRRREAAWLKDLFDESVFEDGQFSPRGVGFSVHRAYPIIKSNTGKPTYLQLKWAIDVIRLWANGVATRRVPQYPDEAAATKQRGGYSGEQKKAKDVGRRRVHNVRRNAGSARAATSAEPEAGAPGAKVARVSQVQAGNRHAPVRRAKRKRAPRVRA
jgi:hypothetical protein